MRIDSRYLKGDSFMLQLPIEVFAVPLLLALRRPCFDDAEVHRYSYSNKSQNQTDQTDHDTHAVLPHAEIMNEPAQLAPTLPHRFHFMPAAAARIKFIFKAASNAFRIATGSFTSIGKPIISHRCPGLRAANLRTRMLLSPS